MRRNMPEPIPVMVLGRLAVDRAHQGRGLGSALLKDALLRTLNAASIAGIRAVLLLAISDDAKRFHGNAGFSTSPVDPMTMMITLADVEKALLERQQRQGCSEDACHVLKTGAFKIVEQREILSRAPVCALSLPPGRSVRP